MGNHKMSGGECLNGEYKMQKINEIINTLKDTIDCSVSNRSPVKSSSVNSSVNKRVASVKKGVVAMGFAPPAPPPPVNKGVVAMGFAPPAPPPPVNKGVVAMGFATPAPLPTVKPLSVKPLSVKKDETDKYVTDNALYAICESLSNVIIIKTPYTKKERRLYIDDASNAIYGLDEILKKNRVEWCGKASQILPIAKQYLTIFDSLKPGVVKVTTHGIELANQKNTNKNISVQIANMNKLFYARETQLHKIIKRLEKFTIDNGSSGGGWFTNRIFNRTKKIDEVKPKYIELMSFIEKELNTKNGIYKCIDDAYNIMVDEGIMVDGGNVNGGRYKTRRSKHRRTKKNNCKGKRKTKKRQ
jgi:hypothetical protein